MTKQIVFSFTLFLTLAFFSYTIFRIVQFFRLTQPAFPVKNIGKRIVVTLKVAMGQTKIFRLPVTGLFHALVFWGFCIILIGSIEMIFDGLTGSERALKFLGGFYTVIIASGDIFSMIVGICIIFFLFRRNFLPVKRFEGIEMKRLSHLDANVALTLILLLMISLTWMNATYFAKQTVLHGSIKGFYPVGMLIGTWLTGCTYHSLNICYEICWWSHILLIFLFANILPYSKHFHVFMSIPNVFLSRLDPLGKLPNMEQVTKEVKMMLNPDFQIPDTSSQVQLRFGVKDCEDVSWKNYLDSLSCTQCGRCTAVCPANLTGKKLSPRKILMDLRSRMKEKGPGLVKMGRDYNDKKSLLRSYISEEELWACTTCQACAKECPININHPTLIIDMRRYLVMEEGSAPGGLKMAFSNIENNGAPWQFSADDRLLWAKDLQIHSS